MAKGAARASERQQAALGKAKTSAQAVSSAGEKARLAFRWEEQGNLVIWHVFKTRPVLVGRRDVGLRKLRCGTFFTGATGAGTGR